MLTENQISDLIAMRLPEKEARQYLLKLTPDKISLALLSSIVHAVRETCVDKSGVLTKLGHDAIDCCGTGGSGLSHFNTSTVVAFVLAAAGVKVVKFGNRAASGSSGSFDFLQALGIGFREAGGQSDPINEAEEIAGSCNLIFLYAPSFYPVLAEFAKLRKAVGVRTVFNFIGPLLNPTDPAYRLLGVSELQMQHLLATFLKQEDKTDLALVVRAENGLDELNPSGVNDLIYINKHDFRQTTFVGTTEIDIPQCESKLTVEDNAAIAQKIFSQADDSSIYFEMVALNAGAGLSLVGKADSIEDGRLMARKIIKDGLVQKKFEECKKVYGKFAKCSS
jgi:anthranilate phosphoribosyltransferase